MLYLKLRERLIVLNTRRPSLRRWEEEEKEQEEEEKEQQ